VHDAGTEIPMSVGWVGPDVCARIHTALHLDEPVIALFARTGNRVPTAA